MPKPKRPVVFMGTPDFAAANLRALLDAGVPVKAVVTQPDRPKGRGQAVAKPAVKLLAEERGLPVHQPAKVRTPAFDEWLREQGAYYVVVVAYGRILPKNILDLPPGGCINVHASLLPRWRGASPIQWAIVNGDEATGVTTMLMDEGLDTGPMLLRDTTPIGPNDDAGSLHDTLAELGARVLLDTLAQLEAGTLAPQPQPEQGETYAPLLKKEDGAVDWTQPAKKVHDLIRGLTPWPGAFTHVEGKYLKLRRSELGAASGTPGNVLAIEKDAVEVAAGDGSVRLLSVQPAGKKAMPAGDFARGARLEIGSAFKTETEA